MITKSVGIWIKQNKLFCLVLLGLGAMYLALSLLRHWHFQSAGFDLGIFDQAIWHYSRFEAPMGTIRVTRHLLADHFHPILMLLAPLYWVIPKVETLLVVQILLWMGGVIPIYLYAKKRGHGLLISLLIVLSYAFFWGITLALNFDFHEIAFALFAIPWAIYLIEIKQWKWFWVCVGLLLLTKEEMGFVVAFFGVYLAVKGYLKQALIAFTAGVSWFLLATKVFIPYFAGPTGGFGYWTYSNFGDNPVEAIKNIFFNPTKAWHLLFNPEPKLTTLRAMFWPFLFLPLISPVMIIGVPLVLQRFWSDQSLYWLADFHYTGTISAILVMALTDTLARVKQFIPNQLFAKQVVLGLAGLSLLANLYYLPSRPLRHLAEPSYWYLSQSDRVGNRVLSAIPTDATISAQNSILPHITHRDYAYLIHKDQEFYYSEYIAISAHANLYPFTTFEEFRSYVEQKLAGKGYRLTVDESGWMIWENKQMNHRPPTTDR